jgi:acetoin utilization protein AcuC
LSESAVFVYRGAALAEYGFGDDHPFGPDRHDAFQHALERAQLGARIQYEEPQSASVDMLALFHSDDYIQRVARLSEQGSGYLDQGDTPAVAGIFEKARVVAGTTVAAVDAIMAGRTRRAFVPIGGLHHATRNSAAGFCVFNDCGIAIEHLRKEYGVARVAYVDIDAHHGDGVFYAFEDDAELIFADIHEDGRFLYPGTGAACETGKGAAAGTKLNLPLPPGADDAMFAEAWEQVEAFVDAARPEFIILQCGADSLAGDPITHLEFTGKSHGYAAKRLCEIADRHATGRILATGGGGYNRDNIALAWTAVVRAMAGVH